MSVEEGNQYSQAMGNHLRLYQIVRRGLGLEGGNCLLEEMSDLVVKKVVVDLAVEERVGEGEWQWVRSE